MQTRRQVLRGGLGLFTLGSIGGLAKAGGGGRCPFTPGGGPPRLRDAPLKSSRPLAATAFDPKPRIIEGFPVRSWFEGDDYNNGIDFPFHTAENDFPGGVPPEPSETVDVVVAGGGLSGLTAAHLLRQYNPVVFEVNPRFGGNARGGVIHGAEYTLGSAYVIAPDPGTFLENIYNDLGLPDVVRVDDEPAPVEINGEINPDLWSGMGVPPQDRPAYERYRQLVMHMADVQYPDVPFANQWERDLDMLSLKQHIEQEVGLPIPTPLQAAIQAYCYASFVAGWEEISATAGWNFLAAEEFGRWVFPGGNAWIADALWRKLLPLDRSDPDHAPHLRGGCPVVDVRVRPDGMVHVTWKNPDGGFRALLARRVVMACQKHICRQIIHELRERDEEKYEATFLQTRPYVVANVVIEHPSPIDFYDIFLLNDPGTFPTNAGDAASFWRYTDVTNGSFAPGPNAHTLPRRRSILTLFWPLPYDTARFDLVLHDPILTFGTKIAPQLRATLELLGLPESAVREIRFSRWGHAVPVSNVGFIAAGTPEILLRPFEGKVYFVNQDNWALPAVENSLIDANNVANAIAADLG